MTRLWIFQGLCAAGLCVLAGCNTLAGQPAIARASIEPQELSPGDSAVITVEVKDRHAIVARMEGVVKEDPRITFRLRDDGNEPDAKAGDGVWSMRVDVPFQAPAGNFTLEFVAYKSDGLAVPVRDEQGNVADLKQSLPVVIRYSQP